MEKFVNAHEHFTVLRYAKHKSPTRDTISAWGRERCFLLAIRNLYAYPSAVKAREAGARMPRGWRPYKITWGVVLALDRPMTEGDVFDLLCHDIKSEIVAA